MTFNAAGMEKRREINTFSGFSIEKGWFVGKQRPENGKRGTGQWRERRKERERWGVGAAVKESNPN